MNNFENFIKDNIDSLEGLPSNVGWSKASGWDKLNAKQSKSAGLGVLGFLTANKQATPWYYAVAASLTVAVASYFVVQDFVTDGIEMNNQTISFVEPVSPAMSEKQGLSVVEKVLSYPRILNVTTKSNEGIFEQNFATSKSENTTQQQEAIQLITSPYLMDQNQASIKDAFMLEQIVTPIQKNQLIFDIQGNGGLIGDNFNAGLEIDLLFQKNNNHAFGIGAKSSYVFASNGFEEKTASNKKSEGGIATFITASYHKNISKNEQKPLWLAIKGGYLAQNNTAVFNDNTISVEVSVNVNDKIKITPQIYLTNNLTKAMPGIKVGMTLGKFQKDISI